MSKDSAAFRGPLWQAWQALEAEVGASLLERAFGDVAVELGNDWMPGTLLASCPVRRRLRIVAEPAKCEAGQETAQACMDPGSLGIASGSVDVVILPHTLEFSASPQAVLREAERILAGEGNLLVTGFNPWSAWSACRWLLGRQNREARSLSAWRLGDWLELLGFEVIASRAFFRRPPVQSAGMLQWMEKLETWPYLPVPGCGYAIMARKHVYGMTPLRLPRRRRSTVTGGVARPAMRGITDAGDLEH